MPYREVFWVQYPAYDPWESFSPESSGVQEKRIVDIHGEFRLDVSAWELGKRAYDILSGEIGEPPTNEFLPSLFWQLYEITDEFQDPLASLSKKGILVYGQSEESPDFEETYRTADIYWRTRVLIEVLDGIGIEEEPLNRRAALASCCLFRLHDVVIADFLDGRNLAYALTEAMSYLTFLDQLEIAKTAVKKYITITAAKRAKKRHQPAKQLRELARELYLAKQWRSVRQAAKDIYPQLVKKGEEIGFRFSDDRGFQTVYEWLLKIDKTIRKQADV